ncbi:MAG: hypothetical protein AAF533_12595 [Acidobacteriota bacterium]
MRGELALYALGLPASLALLHLLCLLLRRRLHLVPFALAGALLSLGLGAWLLHDSLRGHAALSRWTLAWPVLLVPGFLVVGAIAALAWHGAVSGLVTLLGGRADDDRGKTVD